VVLREIRRFTGSILSKQEQLVTRWSYLPDVGETGTVFESLQIGETCTNLKPPPWMMSRRLYQFLLPKCGA
jgi:hypothetical protein